MTVQREPGTARRTPRPPAQAQKRKPVREPESKLSTAVRRVSDFLDSRPLIDYTMIRSIVLILACLGVVMVMSSSMASSFAANASVWSQAARQTIMVFGGLIAFVIALRIPPERLRTVSNWLMVIAVILLLSLIHI